MDQPPTKIDNSPVRDGVRRKLSNPVARVKVDQKFDELMTKSESRSPRSTYEKLSTQEKKKEASDLIAKQHATEMIRRRSESLENK